MGADMSDRITIREMVVETRGIPSLWARVRFVLVLWLIQSMQLDGYDIDLDEP